MAASLIFGIQLACQQTFIALGNAKTSVFLAEPVADIIAVIVTGTMFTVQFKEVLKELGV